MRRIHLSFAWLLFTLTAYTQNLTFPMYRQYINEAEYWSYLGRFDTSAHLLDYALSHSRFTPLTLDIYHAAYAAARSHKKQMCLQYLREAGNNRHEWVKYGVFTRDSAIFEACLSNDYPNIRNFMDSLYQQPAPTASRKEFYEMANRYVDEDQKLLAMKNKDSLNVFHARFLSEIEKNGYPGLNRAGTDVVSIVFLHINEPNYEYAYRLLYDAMEAGEASPHEFAMMVDYYEWRIKKNEKGQYGCHQCTIITTADFDKVVQYRLDLGVSIFFQKPSRTPWMKKTRVDWFDDTNFLSKYFIFNTVVKLSCPEIG